MKTKKYTTLFSLALALIMAAACGGKKNTQENDNTPSVEDRQDTEVSDDETQIASLENNGEEPIAAFSFEQTHHDFGVIKEGEKVSYEYKFTNTGNVPLLVQSVRPSCGCTVSAWTKEPVPVGGVGFVKVAFDSQGKPNVQNKTVTVTANTMPKTTVLHFKAMVTPKSK